MAKQTKAAQVRNIIAAAKVDGLSSDDIVGAVMQCTGHKRQLARAYIKNNWPKVATPPAVDFTDFLVGTDDVVGIAVADAA